MVQCWAATGRLNLAADDPENVSVAAREYRFVATRQAFERARATGHALTRPRRPRLRSVRFEGVAPAQHSLQAFSATECHCGRNEIVVSNCARSGRILAIHNDPTNIAMLRLILGAALLAGLSAPVAAQTQFALTDGDFEKQRAQIDEHLNDGKTYAEINKEERRQVQQSLDRISRLLAGAGSVDKLKEQDKVTIFNDQELVNTILTRAGEDSRKVCERRRVTGSNLSATVCETVAERRRIAEANKEQVERRLRQGEVLNDPTTR